MADALKRVQAETYYASRAIAKSEPQQSPRGHQPGGNASNSSRLISLTSKPIQVEHSRLLQPDKNAQAPNLTETTN